MTESRALSHIIVSRFIEMDRRPLFIHATAYRAMEWAIDGRSYARVKSQIKIAFLMDVLRRALLSKFLETGVRSKYSSF
jgi:hypothetical protein